MGGKFGKYNEDYCLRKKVGGMGFLHQDSSSQNADLILMGFLLQAA